MTEPTFGIQFNHVNDEPRSVIPSNMSTPIIVGTAPAAQEASFPYDTPIMVRSNNSTLRAALGATGTIPDAIKGMADQLGELDLAIDVIVVRVEEGADDLATIANIVGDEATMTGMWAGLLAGPDLSRIPRLWCFPGYTHQIDTVGGATANAICTGVVPILDRVLGHAVVEGPGTNEAAILAWREGLNSRRLIPIDMWVKVQDGASTVVRPGAPRVVGLLARIDGMHDGVPTHSAANRPIAGIVGFARNVDFALTDGDNEGQNLLSKNIGIGVRGELGVETAIADSGFIFVGTDTASDDPEYMFYHVSRGRDYIHLGILRTSRVFLGRGNIEGHNIQAVLNTTQAWLMSLQADRHILGSKVGFEADQNTPENLRLGRFRYYFKAEEPPVLRRLDIDSSRYSAALDTLVDNLLTTVNGSDSLLAA